MDGRWERPNRDERLLVAAVAVHVLFTVGHGLTHAGIPVPVQAWQNAFAVAVILAIPLVAAGAVLAGRAAAGAGLALLAGFSSLTFEALYHFVVRNPDHVGTVDAGQSLFAATAALTTLGDLVLVVAAGWLLWHRRASGTPAVRATVE